MYEHNIVGILYKNCGESNNFINLGKLEIKYLFQVKYANIK